MTDSARALESLCTTYWMPLYAYVRRQGFVPADAEDLTQAFFERVLERNDVGKADRMKGRFRSFLLTALRNFIADELDRVQAWKRGGRVQWVPVDTREAEHWLDRIPDQTGGADLWMDRAWAQVLMRRVGERLREEAVAAGRGDLFAALGVTGGGGERETLEQIGRRFQMSEGAVKLASYRLRQRYRELIREEVAETVGDAVELENELRHLYAVLTSDGVGDAVGPG
jgi:RNA polymerase sigma-70 factor (ECF subfamily)